MADLSSVYAERIELGDRLLVVAAGQRLDTASLAAIGDELAA